jgi:peptide/nickel transport system substrate-binding protein
LPNNRQANDAKIAQAVAQMLTRIGIATKVEAMPSATFSAGDRSQIQLHGAGLSSHRGVEPAEGALPRTTRTRGSARPIVALFQSQVDALEEALATVDDPGREAVRNARPSLRSTIPE